MQKERKDVYQGRKEMFQGWMNGWKEGRKEENVLGTEGRKCIKEGKKEGKTYIKEGR